jgi:aconitate hydratase
MGNNLARQLIADHLVEGEIRPGEEIALKIDQFLTHDMCGPLCALQLEAMGVEEISGDVAAAYCDHLLIEADSKNADDHILLQSAARHFGMWFSRPGNGTSHPVHQQRFGVPGKTLLGTDSHTPGAGGIGMLAIGVGGLEISMALTGEPFRLRMPEIWGIRLTGQLPDWVSAKDVILEVLRRHNVDGGHGRIIEYCGPGALRAAVRTVLDRPAYRLRALQMAYEFARIDTRSEILSIINRAVADQRAPFTMATSQPGARLASGDLKAPSRRTLSPHLR